ncbi:endogenous inhibitor of DNA gyrase (YacG/DUF329 family) [Rhodopirellula rubra]|uniref:Endogenous inhibitor of DNA gyrase (YacG/DUF329 family) n=1 Tax=Aporhodopirellula rubra TaxID=980271 RepID=A0A7W5E5W5_9BACT|nr:hypothetical protein [Aporhodopirellula rubra]MBB3210735.1 endogenous inhibitor of DNA gyrase (YacG/DUF329 family) [Aporhodopirellula rubra]
MVISSRTPDGWPNNCPICGHSISITPSQNTLDAPCPHCGHLLWFADTGLLPIWNSSTKTERFQGHPIPDSIEIADYIFELIPESVARENCVIPVAESADALLVAATSPIELEIIEKLQFILSRRILAVPTTKNWIVAQIDKHYGSIDDAGVA